LGEFSFIGFYARRVRRIFPALIAALVASMIAGWFVMFQDEFRVFGKTGAALLISAGQTTSINRYILGRRAVVHIWLISYPLYMWHWPILVFERIVRINEPTDLMKLGGIGAAFILAGLTYRFIEKPVRFGTSRASWSIGASFALGATACLGLLIYVEDGFPRRIPENVLALNREVRIGAFLPARGFQTCFLAEGRPAVFSKECEGTGPTAAPRFVLWGDSHAASLYDGLEQFERTHGNEPPRVCRRRCGLSHAASFCSLIMA
jgi:hypothetical protein